MFITPNFKWRTSPYQQPIKLKYFKLLGFFLRLDIIQVLKSRVLQVFNNTFKLIKNLNVFLYFNLKLKQWHQLPLHQQWQYFLIPVLEGIWVSNVFKMDRKFYVLKFRVLKVLRTQGLSKFQLTKNLKVFLNFNLKLKQWRQLPLHLQWQYLLIPVQIGIWVFNFFKMKKKIQILKSWVLKVFNDTPQLGKKFFVNSIWT